MSETLNRGDLTPKDRKLLEDTLAKGTSDMTDSDKAVIRARRSYLTSLEREVFRSVLVVKRVEVKKEVVDEVDEEVVDYSKMTKAELEKLCEERGMDVPKGAKKGEIVEMLEKADEE